MASGSAPQAAIGSPSDPSASCQHRCRNQPRARRSLARLRGSQLSSRCREGSPGRQPVGFSCKTWPPSYDDTFQHGRLRGSCHPSALMSLPESRGDKGCGRMARALALPELAGILGHSMRIESHSADLWGSAVSSLHHPRGLIASLAPFWAPVPSESRLQDGCGAGARALPDCSLLLGAVLGAFLAWWRTGPALRPQYPKQ